MMPPRRLFGKDLAGIMGQALGKHLLPATLHKVARGSPMPGMLAYGSQPTETDHACRGLPVDLEERWVDGDLVKRTDRAVMLLVATIAGGVVPVAGDLITIDGAKVSVVAVVDEDPAAATRTVAVRG